MSDPKVPQMEYKLRTFDEYMSGKCIPAPPQQGFVAHPITTENKIGFLLRVIEMMNIGVTENGLKNLDKKHRDLFVKRDDVYFDEQKQTYFLKEEKPNDNPK